MTSESPSPRRRLAGLGLLLLTWMGQSGADQGVIKIQVCSDYHCDLLRPASISNQVWQRVADHFSGLSSATEEREAIRSAIALLETHVGDQTGTAQDRERNNDDGSEVGQLDCISESMNTTTYLLLMEKDRLLRWHRIKQRRSRNPWFFNFHWTAVIEETHSGTEFAVDSWYLANGEPPYIQELKAWLASEEITAQ